MSCSFPGCTIPTPSAWCLRHGKIYGPQTSSKPQQPLAIPDLIDKAQKVFNTFIRDRDRAFGCITCNNSIDDAGHYIPVGTNSTLRFDEINTNGQCRQCNVFKAGNTKVYRLALIEKVGIDKVIRLETSPKYGKFSREFLLKIIEKYSSAFCLNR